MYQTATKQLPHRQATPAKKQLATTNKTEKQINIKGISNKEDESDQPAHTTQPDAITLKETKLTTFKTPTISNHTSIRTDGNLIT